MTNGEPQADYMLVIDSDMQLRHPFKPDHYNMTKGETLPVEGVDREAGGRWRARGVRGRDAAEAGEDARADPLVVL